VRLGTLLTRAAPLQRPLALRDRATAAPAGAAQLPARADRARMVAPFVRLPLLAQGPQQGESRRPSPVTLSFIALVLVPIAVAAAYLFVIAADQYVSEFRFSLSSIDPPRLDTLSLLAGNASHSAAGVESQIVVQYITSRAIVDELDGALNLRRMFSPPEADWWARLPRPTSIEALVQYWRGQVDPFYDPANGTVVVRVRAFAASDALQLAQAIVAASEKLVNELSSRARHDTVSHAEQEVAQAETRLKAALGEVRAFRDREGVIDPGRSAEAAGGLAARLRDELVRTNAELATLQSYMRDDAPSVKVVKARIRSLESQQRVVAQGMTDPDRSRADTLSRQLGSYEQLDSERRFAEAAYQHTLHGLDQARANADRQQVYIASFVPPSLPEEALYPRRWRSLGVVALLAFAFWAIGGLTVQSIRDHL
jgi:capsular polysaccharide transport system permease protein